MLDLIGWSSLPAGLLPKWLWIVGVTSFLNTFQAFATLTATRRIYANKPHEGIFDPSVSYPRVSWHCSIDP